MALTEIDRLEKEKFEIQKKIDFNNEIIVASAKYERALSNKDYLTIIDDVKRVREVLEREILMLSKQLVMTHDPVERETVYNEFMEKSIRLQVVTEASTYAERIVHEANVAKEENVELKNKLKEISNG